MRKYGIPYCEGLMSKQLLTETMPVTFQVVEEAAMPEATRDGRMRIEGRFQRVDVKNDNGRRYRKELLERELKSLNERLSGGVLSAADHPSDGKSRFGNVAAKIEEVSLDEDGWVKGRMVMLNTAIGKDAQEIIRSGVQVNVSARGFGTLKPGKMPDGSDVQDVQEDYNLVTYDLVLSDPGFRGASIQSFTEEKETMKTVEELTAAYPELVASIEKAAAEKAVTESKEQLTKEITEQVKAAQPDVEKVVEERVAAEKDAIKAAVLEQLKAEGIEDAKNVLGQIAELMKPFMGIEAEEVPPDEKDAQLEALHQEKAQLEEEKAALEVKIAEKEEAEAAAQRRLAVKNRIDEALKSNADAEKIRPILEKCQTVEDVDAELPKVTALVEALKRKATPKDGERKGTPPPTEAEKPQLTEEQAAHRRMAGIKS